MANLLGGSVGGLLSLQGGQNYMQQQMANQMAQNYYGTVTMGTPAISNTLTNAVVTWTQLNFATHDRAVAVVDTQPEALKWLDRRVNEMRLKL